MAASWVSHQRLDNGDIQLRWSDVQQLLGRPYRGDDEDDCRIVEFLRRDVGLPEWIEEAEGYQDRLGWYLKSPVQFNRTAFMAWLGKVAQPKLLPTLVADEAAPGDRSSGRSRLATELRASADVQSNRRGTRLRAVVVRAGRQNSTRPDVIGAVRQHDHPLPCPHDRDPYTVQRTGPPRAAHPLHRVLPGPACDPRRHARGRHPPRPAHPGHLQRGPRARRQHFQCWWKWRTWRRRSSCSVRSSKPWSVRSGCTMSPPTTGSSATSKPPQGQPVEGPKLIHPRCRRCCPHSPTPSTQRPHAC